jgi:threonine/homoserine/homoserine lactone efflux protein
MKALRLFYISLLISFIGTLPMGTLNTAVLQISISDGIQAALYFSTGALLVEVFMVRISLIAMKWIFGHKVLLRTLEWLPIIIILCLAAGNIFAAIQPNNDKNIILSHTIHHFWLGVGMSFVNPMQIPFWFGWSKVLLDRGILGHQPSDRYVYITGIGLGTFLGNAVFIWGGRLLVEKLNADQHVLNWLIGGIFAITAVIQIIKMIRHDDPISKMEDNINPK